MREKQVRQSKKMQDTCNPVFPQIPLGWQLIPLRHVLTFVAGAGFPDIEQGQSDRELPFFKVKDLGLGATSAPLSSTDNSVSRATARRLRANVIPPNAIAFAKIGAALLLNRFRMIGVPCCLDNNMMAAIPKPDKIIPGYAYWVLGRLDMTLIVNPGAVPSLNESKLAAIKVPIPPTRDQTLIADFLDRETAKIDALIAKQTEFLTLLDEHRRGLVTEAVTKGLDPSVSLTNTEVEWFGKIPSHWRILSLRRVVSKFVDYRGSTPEKIDSGVPLITASAIKGGVIDHSLNPVFISAEEYNERMVRGFPKAGDVVLTTEAPLGEVAQIHDSSMAIGQRVILFKVNEAVMTPRYLFHFLRSAAGQSELISLSSGSTAVGIKAERLKGIDILVPPLPEQLLICSTIDERMSRIPRLTARAETQIALLRERRSALITAAVTGQIDVTQASPISVAA